MKTAEIRTKFIQYFKNRQHQVVESSSLVPSNDPTLLFTNAGMVQFKDVFLGLDRRSYSRAVTAQKCVRAGGKHNDLENVGFTARHHTFFEMLGNFSFGDYFKKEAIALAWEFVTVELGLPKDKLYVTVYKDDEEAAKIWHEDQGVPKDRIFRFGEKDNFWAMGETGPCGPCSEIFIDRGTRAGKPGCGTDQKPVGCGMGCDCDRYLEFWNLVFMQYDRDASGKMQPLPKPSVDTGAGLERIASILQNVETNYDTDAFVEIIKYTSKILNLSDSKVTVSHRVIADHARAAAFLVSDGVLPSNEGRGYVLRRILRRAIRHGRNLGAKAPFIYKVCEFVIDMMKDAYPDLESKKSFVQKVISTEEEQFFKTLEKGLALLDQELVLAQKSKTLPGAAAFKLYDTFGFPMDLTRVIASEQGVTVDEVGFEKEMARQRAESRKNWKGSGEEGLASEFISLSSELRNNNKLPEFSGYNSLRSDGVCVALLDSNRKRVESVEVAAKSGQEPTWCWAIFSKTPFYGESGGQVGDQGLVVGNGLKAQVLDVQKPTQDLTVCQIEIVSGKIVVGTSYTQTVDEQRRKATTRNHTATHLLHWALRTVLGDHVKQSGSLVSPDLLRFDFTSFAALTPEELHKVESMVNEKIWANSGVTQKIMSKDEALKSGAIAFFGDKYGDTVRVISVGDYSTEFCGGCHVEAAQDIHMFKIVSESSIASGVRRMIAYTSQKAFEYLDQRQSILEQMRDPIRAQTIEEIPARLQSILTEEKNLRKQIERFAELEVEAKAKTWMGMVKKAGDYSVIVQKTLGQSSDVAGQKDLLEKLKEKDERLVIVSLIESQSESKVSLLIASGKQAMKTKPANELLKLLIPVLGGKGGGKPDFAQGGGTVFGQLDRIQAETQKWLEMTGAK